MFQYVVSNSKVINVLRTNVLRTHVTSAVGRPWLWAFGEGAESTEAYGQEASELVIDVAGYDNCRLLRTIQDRHATMARRRSWRVAFARCDDRRVRVAFPGPRTRFIFGHAPTSNHSGF